MLCISSSSTAEHSSSNSSRVLRIHSDPAVRRLGQADGRQGRIDHLPVGVEGQRQLADGHPATGQAVDRQRPEIDLRRSAARVQKSAMPIPRALPCVASVSPRTAMRRTLGNSSATASDSLNFRPMTFVSMPVPLTFLPISSTINRSSRSSGSRGNSSRASTSSAFSRVRKSAGSHGFDLGRLFVTVFDDRQPGHDRAAGQHFAADALDDLAEGVILKRAVIDLGPVVIAQPDQHHLHQAAFDLAGEIGVRLDAAANQHVVGLEGLAVEIDRKALAPSGRRPPFPSTRGSGSRKTPR